MLEVLYGNFSLFKLKKKCYFLFQSERYMATYSFDGVDIALEFPDGDVPDDKAALTTLLEVC